jgi:hypothetical protein
LEGRQVISDCKAKQELWNSEIFLFEKSMLNSVLHHRNVNSMRNHVGILLFIVVMFRSSPAAQSEEQAILKTQEAMGQASTAGDKVA